MATQRMDVTSFVGKLLEEDDVDLLREGVRVLAQALMETEVSSQIGAGPYERSSAPSRVPQRLPHQDLGHAGRHHRTQSAQGHRGHVLPLPPRASPAGREGPARRDLRGLRDGPLHPQGRRPGPSLGDGRNLQERGLQDLQGPGRGREDVPHQEHRGAPVLPNLSGAAHDHMISRSEVRVDPVARLRRPRAISPSVLGLRRRMARRVQG
jgi:hypothetical protein